MAKVLKCDLTSNSAIVEADFSSSPYTFVPTEVWVEYDIAFNSTFLAAVTASQVELGDIVASGSGYTDFLDIINVSGLKWQVLNAAAFTPASPIVALQFYHVKSHVTQSPFLVETWIDTVLVGSDNTGSIDDLTYLDTPATGLAVAGAIVYVDNFKVGTTEGASDLINDDFESGSISPSIWNGGAGADASVIDDPGIAPPAGGGGGSSIPSDGIYYVDIGADSTFAASSYVSVYPEELEWSEEIRTAGEISFQLSYSAKDLAGNSIGSYARDWVAPNRIFWRLRFGDIAICAGWITKTNSKLGSDFMGIYGRTWEDVPSRWEYPFDPRTTERIPGVPSSAPVHDFVFPNSFQNNETVGSGVPTPTGLTYQASNRDVISIFSDIFVQTMSGVPHRITFDLSTLVGLSGVRTNYQFSLGDSTKMDAFINSLSVTGDGFDWWFSWNKKLYWASPYRFGNPSAPAITYTITNADLDTGFLLEADFTNDGILATHVLGTGAGLASQTTLARAYGYSPGQVQFSRIDESYDFGDVRNANQIVKKTQRQLALGLNPVHEIPISVDPAKYGTGARDYWMTFRKGRAIWATLDFGYHLVDSAQRLKAYSAKMNNEGDVQVDWTLEQIYPQSTNVGTAEG